MLSDKKKILMLATTAAMIEQFNKDNILILEEMGYEIHVAGNWLEGNPISKERLEEFKEWLGVHHGKWFHIPSTRRPTDLKNNGKAYRYVVGLIKEYRYDFIHCHTPIGSVIGRLAAKRTRTKVIYTAHGFHFFKGAPLKNWLLYFPVEWFCSWMTDVLITINTEDYGRAKKHLHAKRTEYIPGVGVDVEKFADCHVDKKEKCKELGIPDDKFILLSVGELQERKNHKVVIDALGKMQNRDIYYLIAGQGDLKEKYEYLIKKYGLENNIRLLGYRTDIDELCEIADCFVHTAFHEGLSVALLEAMASSLPLITADINGLKDYYTQNSISGCCIDPNSEKEMEIAINKMFHEPEFRQICSFNNLMIVKKYSTENTSKIMNMEYNILFGRVGVKHIIELIKAEEKRKEMGISTDDFVIISVGELNSNKNHEVIIKAIAELKNPNVKYLICGQGELAEYLSQKIKQYRLDGQIMLLGYRTDVKELLKMSDLFAFPSKREGLGLAALEAMAAGLPLITSDIHGINDYSKYGVTGYKERSDNYTAYAKDIIKCMEDQYTLYIIGKNNQKSVRKFSKFQTRIIMKGIYSKAEG